MGDSPRPSIPLAEACPLCGASAGLLKDTLLRTCEDRVALGEYAVYECAGCRNAFTHPRLEGESAFLAPDIPLADYGAVQKRLMEWFRRIRIRRVLAAGGRGRPLRVLDVGGGSCAFANALAREDALATVVEYNPANRIHADTAAGVRFIAAPFEDALVSGGELREGEFDVVTMWHSLEHMPRPENALRLARRLLKPEGSLCLSVPNFASIQARVGGNRWTYLDVPHHLWHFTPEGLDEVLRRAGFRQVRRHGSSAEYEVFGFFQTLLNAVSLSHNYYYNRSKKRRDIRETLRYPRWTKAVTFVGFLVLPPAILLSILAAGIGMPSCIEIDCAPLPASVGGTVRRSPG